MSAEVSCYPRGPGGRDLMVGPGGRDLMVRPGGRDAGFLLCSVNLKVVEAAGFF